MTKKSVMRLLAATAICTVALIPVASAQSLQDLKDQINALSKKVEVLEKTQAKKKASGMKVKWKGAPEFSSPDGKFKMKIRGRLFFDYGSVTVKDGAGTNIPADKINGTEVRTARLGVEGVVFKNVKYKFEADFAGNKVTVKDAYMQYKFKPVSVTVGQFKHMNSLEEQTSSRYMTFMERASFTDAFKLSRRVGIAVGSGGKNWTVKAGYFFEGFGSTNASKNDSNLFAARATFSPDLADGVKVHLGASFFSRNENGDTYNHGYKQRPHNHQAGKFVRSQKFDIDRETFFGLEMATVMGPFSAQAEWAWMKNSLATSETATSKDPKYNGGYISLSYFLTGESRSYSGKKGSFGRTKVANPVNEGGSGAFQIAARYDVIDLVHETFGEKQNTLLLGVNWHLNNYSRIMANYSHSTVKNSIGVTNNKIDAIGARFQVDW
ncbi:Phosphate-specific outer membrane porin OprP; Pyrophosphate-specific outer membrane porin OprO [hydrothermal vent metagenome]|uniref:Phosphate-specific outer membrane porin OprP Pyrophosphate-specific outer membrane porin OprO n=1 Tax=hydrothermal vent metagenome TaxID=652676 RepID=A0A3B0RMG1_9ZZZZ